MNHPAITAPLFALAGAAGLILLFFFRPDADGRSPAAKVAGVGFGGAAFLLLLVWGGWGTDFDGFLYGDTLGSVAALVAVLAGLLTVFTSAPFLRKAGREPAEFHALLLLAVAGMVAMVITGHLVTIFIGLETMSLALYVLSASLRERRTSIEAGAKYFLAGAFASGILLMGIALVYGATGKLSLPEIAAGGSAGTPLALTGLLLMLVGFGFKVAAAPFHQWAPDVYEGAPTPVTGFMSTTVKLVAFTALIRVVEAFSGQSAALTDVLCWLAALTMIAGNLGALAQRSVKRMLAYSSISHAGYVLAGVAVLAAVPRGDPAAAAARAAVLLYLVVYTAMNLGAFGVLSAVETSDEKGLGFDDLGALKQRHPLLAGCMMLFMISLAGVPPTGGFLAKWRIFETLVDRFSVSGDRSWMVLIVLLAVNSVVGLAYYLRVVMAMYMAPAPAALPVYPRPAWSTCFAVVVCAFLTLWLGFGPTFLGFGAEGLLTWVRSATGVG